MYMILKQILVIVSGIVMVMILGAISYFWIFAGFNVVLKSIFCPILIVIIIVGGGLPWSYFKNKFFPSDKEFINSSDN